MYYTYSGSRYSGRRAIQVLTPVETLRFPSSIIPPRACPRPAPLLVRRPNLTYT